MTLFPNPSELPQVCEALITEDSLLSISKFTSTYFHHTFISFSFQKMKLLPLSYQAFTCGLGYPSFLEHKRVCTLILIFSPALLLAFSPQSMKKA